MVDRNDEPQYPIDAIALLKTDHQKVKNLFARYESAGDFSTKHLIAEQIFTELALHTQLEENVFYPAYDEMTGKNGTQLVADSRHAYFFMSTSSPSAHARATAKFPCSSPGILSQPPFVMTFVRS